MMRKMTIIVVVMLLFVSEMSHNANNSFGDGTSNEAVLTWDYPTTNTDGTVLTDLAGFKVYYGTASGNYSTVIDVAFATCVTASPCSSSTFTVTNLSVATYYFAVTAYDTSGNESEFSDEVSKTISGTPPPTSIPAPTGIQVTANGGTVTVSWDKSNSSSVAGYQIQRGPTPTLFSATYDVGLGYSDSTPCVVSYSGCTRRQFIFNGVVPGTYFWRVIAYDSSGTFGEASAAASVTISSDTTVPADVTSFSAVKYGTGTRLSWTNPSDPDFYGLLLEYSFNNSAGPWALLANLRGIPGTNQTYDHLNLIAGTYTYRIHTKDTSGNVTSTEYASLEISPPESYPTDITNFMAHPNEYAKEVTMFWDQFINPYIKSIKLEYRIIGYSKKVVLLESDYNPYFDWIQHNYSDRLIGEKVEYTLTLIDDKGDVMSQASTIVEIPAKLNELTSCECGGGGGGYSEVVLDNAAEDFPKAATVQKKKKESGGFGCGTISNSPPSGGNGTDASAVTLVATLLFLLYCRSRI